MSSIGGLQPSFSLPEFDGVPTTGGELRAESPLAAHPVLQEVAAGLSEIARGARGPEVQLVQQAMADAGIEVRGGIDGIFGSGTQAAVRDLQGRTGLPETGVLDSATLLALDGLGRAELSEGSPLAAVPQLQEIAAGLGTLARGARGPAVEVLQRSLQQLGVEVRGGVDGSFGRGTEAAVASFQRTSGLPASGVLDADTLHAIDLGLQGASTPTTPDTPAPVDVSGVTAGMNASGAEAEGIQNPRFDHAELAAVANGRGSIGRGARGPHVTALQTSLMDLGFKLPAYGADGSYGGEMARAVERFQLEMGIPRTGTINEATMEALDRVATPPGQALERNPDYASIFADGRADMTIAIGYDEHGTTAGTLQKTLRSLQNQGFRSINPARLSGADRERYGLTDDRVTPGARYFVKTGDDPATGEQVDYVCRVFEPNSSDDPSEVAGMFQQALEQDEVVIYNGHARYGTGPDFDDSHSGAGNFVINEAGNSHGSSPPAYLADAIAGRDTDLAQVGNPGKYQLVFFNACSTENYLENLRERFPGRTNDNTDFVSTTVPTYLASGADHVNLFMEGVLNRESINQINEAINDNEVGWVDYFNEDDGKRTAATNTSVDNGFLGNPGNRLVPSPN